MDKNFYDAVKERRSYYAISNESTLTDQGIEEILKHALLHSPSAFNSQSGRAILLLGNHHKKLWQITMEALRKKVPAEKFAPTEEKINSFAHGYASILFFEDESVVKDMQKQFPSYQANFPLWSLQSSGMLQYVVWTALESEGFGVSLQHYNELIIDAIRAEWNIPNQWQLISQMPFGKPTAMPAEKEFAPLENRMKVYK